MVGKFSLKMCHAYFKKKSIDVLSDLSLNLTCLKQQVWIKRMMSNVHNDVITSLVLEYLLLQTNVQLFTWGGKV